MTTDTNRAAFVLQDVRLTTATNEAVKTRFGDAARSVTLPSNMSEEMAKELAQKVLTANANPKSFNLEVEGVLPSEAFIGGCPRYIPDFTKFATDGRAMKVVGYSTDYGTGVTTMRIRG